MNENLTKAQGAAAFLLKDLRSAHSDACTANPLLEILLLDLIGQAAVIETKIKHINLALQESA